MIFVAFLLLILMHWHRFGVQDMSWQFLCRHAEFLDCPKLNLKACLLLVKTNIMCCLFL